MESFGALLKRHRLAAGWTQAELAERAGLSVYSISNLEREVAQTPRKDTVALLANALGLGAEGCAALLAAIRRTRTGAITGTTRVNPHIARFHLPTPPRPLLGRAQEVQEACALLRQQQVRLLTVAGPAGVGKTHLALVVAREVLDVFADGCCFVGLAPISDPNFVVPRIAQSLGLSDSGTQEPLETLQAHVRDRELLLVLDNFEQVVAAASQVAVLLSTCPGLVIMVTSRAMLHVRGEQVFPVAPLALPEIHHLPELQTLAQVPAVALFVECARAVAPDFTLSAQHAEAVVEICHRLDGLPLAIELAASWVRVLTPEMLLARMERRLPLLTGGPQDLLAHQRTLRDTIAWSYELLTAAEQQLFRHLAVFAGGATLEMLEAIEQSDEISAPAEDSGGSPTAIISALRGLVDQGLVECVDVDGAGDAKSIPEANTIAAAGNELGGGARRTTPITSTIPDTPPTRFRMLGTIREYASELLETSGQRAAAERAHLEYFTALAEVAEPHLRGTAQRAWMWRLEAEHDNVSAALAYALEHGTVEIGLRLAAALRWHWITRGYITEGREWLRRLLAAEAGADTRAVPAAPIAPAVRVRALHVAGVLAYEHSDYDQAVALYEESLALRRELGDQQGIAMMLNNLGIIAAQRDEYPRAISLYEESLALRRVLGDQRGQATVLTGLGVVAHLQGDYMQARRHHMRSLWIKRELGDLLGQAVSLHNLGAGEFQRGNYARARTLCEKSLDLARELQVTTSIASTLNTLGRIHCAEGDLTGARSLLWESLECYQATRSMWGLAEAYESQGYLACLSGDIQAARRWYRCSLRRYHTIEMQRGIASGLEGLAWAECAAGHVEPGVELWAAAEALRQRMSCPMPPQERGLHQRAQQHARGTLGALCFEAAWKRGQSARLDDLVLLALQRRQGEMDYDQHESMLEA